MNKIEHFSIFNTNLAIAFWVLPIIFKVSVVTKFGSHMQRYNIRFENHTSVRIEVTQYICSCNQSSLVMMRYTAHKMRPNFRSLCRPVSPRSKSKQEKQSSPQFSATVEIKFSIKAKDDDKSEIKSRSGSGLSKGWQAAQQFLVNFDSISNVGDLASRNSAAILEIQARRWLLRLKICWATFSFQTLRVRAFLHPRGDRN